MVVKDKVLLLPGVDAKAASDGPLREEALAESLGAARAVGVCVVSVGHDE